LKNHQSVLKREVGENQIKIKKVLQTMNQKLLEAIEQSKRDAKNQNVTFSNN